ncbi:pyridoxal-phosphate dependent enzyme [Dactylosporangium darangshiense]|uniref:Threonine/serine dehydratase n=1 Tax=Dactylosporangium darangshiense TaxID=579108 RepID=A0ABP8DRS5_9ACTN
MPRTKGDHVAAIRHAWRRVAGTIVRTPVVAAGGALVKREDLQVCGSFKTRGAANFLFAAPPSQQCRGVVCASSGNTGRALATLNTTPTYVFVPADADESKIRRLLDCGARVVPAGGDFATVSAAAREFAAAHELLYCSSATIWDFIYGNATLGLELLQQCGRLDEIFVPIGGGGLAAGVGLALSLLPKVRRPALIGVELTVSCPVREHLAPSAGERATGESIADCMVGGLEAGAIILDLAAHALDDVVLVSDAQLLQAQEELAHLGVAVGPGPAAAFAGYRSRSARAPSVRSGIVVSGIR